MRKKARDAAARMCSLWTAGSEKRGQLVLLTAALIAVGLLVITAAYLQTGYTGGQQATVTPATDNQEIQQALELALLEAEPTTGTQRNKLVTEFQASFEKQLREIQQSATERGTVVQLTRNQTAGRHAVTQLSGSGSPSESIGGVIVQQRAGEAHVVGVAVDIEHTGPNTRVERTTVITMPEVADDN